MNDAWLSNQLKDKFAQSLLASLALDFVHFSEMK